MLAVGVTIGLETGEARGFVVAADGRGRSQAGDATRPGRGGQKGVGEVPGHPPILEVARRAKAHGRSSVGFRRAALAVRLERRRRGVVVAGR